MSGLPCDGKVRFASRREAAEAIRAIMRPARRKPNKRRPKRLVSHPCVFCGGWHLTSREWLANGPRRRSGPPAKPEKFDWRKATNDEQETA